VTGLRSGYNTGRTRGWEKKKKKKKEKRVKKEN